eukprot:c44575_g1_i1 orf=106-336(+)
MGQLHWKITHLHMHHILLWLTCLLGLDLAYMLGLDLYLHEFRLMFALLFMSRLLWLAVGTLALHCKDCRHLSFSDF